MRVGPFTPTVLVRKRYLFFYFFLIWISTICVFLELWVYYQLFLRPDAVLFLVFLPFLFFIMYITLVLSSLVFAKILLIIVNALHTPKEGLFLRDPSDKDFRYWSIRNTIKRWPVWLAHKFPFPFLDNLCFKMFGVKTKFSNSLFEGWVDTEFIEFGENVVIGQAGIVQSEMIIGNYLIIKKIIIEDDVMIGTHSFVMPGTHMRKNSILASFSSTLIDQELEEGWIYLGVPAQKHKKNRFIEDNIEDLIGQVKDNEELRKKYEDDYYQKYEERHSILERRQIKKEKMEVEKRRLELGG
jgi:acetyltransferase-like isoleucine patch superfamily enzyme